MYSFLNYMYLCVNTFTGHSTQEGSKVKESVLSFYLSVLGRELFIRSGSKCFQSPESHLIGLSGHLQAWNFTL